MSFLLIFYVMFLLLHVEGLSVLIIGDLIISYSLMHSGFSLLGISLLIADLFIVINFL